MLESQSYGWNIRNLIVTRNGGCVWGHGLDIADRSSTKQEHQAGALGINAAQLSNRALWRTHCANNVEQLQKVLMIRHSNHLTGDKP